jgi:hypothetical protein
MTPKTGVAYFGNRFPGHAHRDLAVIAHACDYVVHTLSEADFNFHRAALDKIFKETRRWKLEIWADPWGLGGVFGGEALSKFLVDNPEEWQRFSDGRPAPAACLNSRRFRDFVKIWVNAAADLGAQVIFWDEPHAAFTWALEWEGVYSCVCSRCQDLYRQSMGGSLPALLTPDAVEFRRRTVRAFLQEMTNHARRKKLKNALCLYAFDGYRPYDDMWNDLSALPEVDIFGCDPYWRWSTGRRDPVKHVQRYAERLKSTVRSDQGTQIWIQSMRLPAGTEGEIGKAVRAAAESGVTHIAAWSYDGGALLDPVLAEDPARVWAETAKAFSSLKSK